MWSLDLWRYHPQTRLWSCICYFDERGFRSISRASRSRTRVFTFHVSRRCWYYSEILTATSPIRSTHGFKISRSRIFIASSFEKAKAFVIRVRFISNVIFDIKLIIYWVYSIGEHRTWERRQIEIITRKSWKMRGNAFARAINCEYLSALCRAAKFYGKQRTRTVVYACVDIP